MNLNKLDVALCFAFQQSEGPFLVSVIYSDKKEWIQSTREKLKKLSDKSEVIKISLEEPPKERRSELSIYLRSFSEDHSDRRINSRFIE
jgi:uncharacterized protein YdeI (YjbR/CyaY-like superfamily)